MILTETETSIPCRRIVCRLRLGWPLHDCAHSRRGALGHKKANFQAMSWHQWMNSQHDANRTLEGLCDFGIWPLTWLWFWAWPVGVWTTWIHLSSISGLTKTYNIIALHGYHILSNQIILFFAVRGPSQTSARPLPFQLTWPLQTKTGVICSSGLTVLYSSIV